MSKTLELHDDGLNTFGTTAATTRIEAIDVLYNSFLIKAANVLRKELIVLSHASGSMHLAFSSSATYVTPIELFFHDVWVEDRYTGDVYGIIHHPPYGTATAVTFQDDGDTVTFAAHGRNNNEKVKFTTVTGTTGITAGPLYFVRNETENTFQLSSTLGGDIIALTTNGTGAMHPLTGFITIMEVT